MLSKLNSNHTPLFIILGIFAFLTLLNVIRTQTSSKSSIQLSYRKGLDQDVVDSMQSLLFQMSEWRDTLERGQIETLDVNKKFLLKLEEKIEKGQVESLKAIQKMAVLPHEMEHVESKNLPVAPIPSQEKVIKDWTIIAFSDITYTPAAEFWYKQLSALGHNNHKIIALDDAAYKKLSSKGFRVESALFYLKHDGTSKLSNLWSLRLKTLQKYVESNQNIFISDVDSIWVSYRDLNDLPENIDTFHGTGKTYPQDVYDQWGFVICGCIGGYRSNSKTKAYFKKLVEQCDNKCDDQNTINKLLANEFQYNWKKPPGMDNRLGQATSPNYPNLSSMTFSDMEVQRGKKLENYDCPNDKPWIISPNSKKLIWNKLNMFRQVGDCFVDGVLNDLEGVMDELDKEAKGAFAKKEGDYSYD